MYSLAFGRTAIRAVPVILASQACWPSNDICLLACAGGACLAACFLCGMCCLDLSKSSSPQVVQAMCNLLGSVFPRLPSGVVRAKFVGGTALLTSLLEEHRAQVGC